jgi:hypothetical protein
LCFSEIGACGQHMALKEKEERMAVNPTFYFSFHPFLGVE